MSGIAGDAPAWWVERGWASGRVVVYLSDQEITCDKFPTEVTTEFPPGPEINGATIMLYITEKNNSTGLQYGSFDIVNSDNQGGISSGLSTDVRAGLTGAEEGGVRGWLEYTNPEGESPQVEASSTFDVPFCG